jgi:hypothetical protein
VRGGDDFGIDLLNSGSEVPHRGWGGFIRYTIILLDSEMTSK